MLDGCSDWQNDGLTRPKSVVASTDNYFEAQDRFRQWLDEECDCEPDNPYKTELAKDLFAAWTNYAKSAGAMPGSQAKFGESLQAAGFKNWRATGGTRTWRGIRLQSVRPVE